MQLALKISFTLTFFRLGIDLCNSVSLLPDLNRTPETEETNLEFLRPPSLDDISSSHQISTSDQVTPSSRSPESKSILVTHNGLSTIDGQVGKKRPREDQSEWCSELQRPVRTRPRVSASELVNPQEWSKEESNKNLQTSDRADLATTPGADKERGRVEHQAHRIATRQSLNGQPSIKASHYDGQSSSSVHDDTRGYKLGDLFDHLAQDCRVSFRKTDVGSEAPKPNQINIPGNVISLSKPQSPDEYFVSTIKLFFWPPYELGIEEPQQGINCQDQPRFKVDLSVIRDHIVRAIRIMKQIQRDEVDHWRGKRGQLYHLLKNKTGGQSRDDLFLIEKQQFTFLHLMNTGPHQKNDPKDVHGHEEKLTSGPIIPVGCQSAIHQEWKYFHPSIKLVYSHNSFTNRQTSMEIDEEFAQSYCNKFFEWWKTIRYDFSVLHRYHAPDSFIGPLRKHKTSKNSMHFFYCLHGGDREVKKLDQNRINSLQEAYQKASKSLKYQKREMSYDLFNWITETLSIMVHLNRIVHHYLVGLTNAKIDQEVIPQTWDFIDEYLEAFLSRDFNLFFKKTTGNQFEEPDLGSSQEERILKEVLRKDWDKGFSLIIQKGTDSVGRKVQIAFDWLQIHYYVLAKNQRSSMGLGREGHLGRRGEGEDDHSVSFFRKRFNFNPSRSTIYFGVFFEALKTFYIESGGRD